MVRAFILIPIGVWRLPISVNQRVILSEVISLHKGGSCYASSRHFAELTGLSISATRKAITNLIEAEYIERGWKTKGGVNVRTLTPAKIEGVPADGNPPYPVEGSPLVTAVTPLPADGNPPYPVEGNPPTLGGVPNRTENKQSKRTVNKIPPALDEVIKAFTELGKTEEGEKFYNYYEANGWVQGAAKKPIKNWKAAARNWIKNADKYNHEKRNYSPTEWDRNALENWASKTHNQRPT